MNRSTLSKTWYTQEEFGNPIYSTKYFFDAVQSALTSPQDPSSYAPVIHVRTSSLDGVSSFTCDVYVKITYHCQWFDLKTATIT